MGKFEPKKLEVTKKDEERKKAAPPIVLLRGAHHAARLATGGMGAGISGSGLAGLFALGTKSATVMLLVCMGIGAWEAGQFLRPGDTGKDGKLAMGAASMAAARADYQVDASKLPSDYKFSNSMQVVPESIDGKTAEQRAAEEAEKARKEKEEADRKAKEEADAAAKAGDEAAPKTEASGGSLGSATAAVEGAKKSAFPSKMPAFGSSGGTNLNGGAGYFGGVSQPFAHKLGQIASMNATPSTPKRAPAAAIPQANSRGRGAFKQLTRTAQVSQAGANVSVAETSAQTADQAFNNNPGANQVITGKGAGSSGNTGGAGAKDSGLTPNPTSGSEGGQTSGGSGDAPTPGHTNASPWKMWTLIGGMCLMIATILLFMIPLVKKAHQWQMAKAMAAMALAMGAMAAMCGFAIMGMGQKKYGILMIAGGALIAVLAALAMRGDEDAGDESGNYGGNVIPNQGQAGVGYMKPAAGPGIADNPYWGTGANGGTLT